MTPLSDLGRHVLRNLRAERPAAEGLVPKRAQHVGANMAKLRKLGYIDNNNRLTEAGLTYLGKYETN